ncbi:hypothetical protein [Microlunatus flavus]|uniref:Tat (Twin-arginine translocation) pathway signal sequence n=1 Tax=Microlunatus flavus TaxID=1036181 RepID=A0A1H9A271_9ACTN|nr:hypothetical protein [Microlunatus flavus]SEP70770.1 hypothetical protein SAMN05421756_101448 [Microlunatus flavus]
MTRTTRRGFLALGLVSAAGLALAGSAEPALAAAVTVGGLQFDVPDDLRPAAAGAELGGGTWQWRGVRGTPAGAAGFMVVLARADLDSTDGGEVVGLMLADGLDGHLPGLVVGSRRSRSMPGGGEQLRLDLTYGSAPRTLRGTLLVATREDRPAAVLAVLGDDTLTAGDLATVLDSARWAS